MGSERVRWQNQDFISKAADARGSRPVVISENTSDQLLKGSSVEARRKGKA